MAFLISYNFEKISKEEYIDFLKKTDLGGNLD